MQDFTHARQGDGMRRLGAGDKRFPEGRNPASATRNVGGISLAMTGIVFVYRQ
jgi:hypothetical protein